MEVQDKRGWHFTLVENDLLTDTNLSSNEKLTYIVLSMFSNKNNSKPVFPSHQTLCDYVGITKPTAIKALKSLQEKGYIKVNKTKRNDGGNGNNIYTLLPYSKCVESEGVVKNFNHTKLKNFSKGSLNSLHEQEQIKQEQKITIKDMSKGQANKQNTLLDLPKEDVSGETVSKSSKKGNRTHAQLAADKIADARNGLVDWNKVTNRDFTHYYLEQHNKLFKPISLNMYKDIGVIRDDLIGRYSLPPEQVCDVIDTLLNAYKGHPKQWDSLTFNMLQSNRKLIDELMEVVNRQLNPVETKYDDTLDVEDRDNSLPDIF